MRWLSLLVNEKQEGTCLQPVILVEGAGTGGCFWPGATGIKVPVGSAVLADREWAWMAVSEGPRQSTEHATIVRNSQVTWAVLTDRTPHVVDHQISSPTAIQAHSLLVRTGLPTTHTLSYHQCHWLPDLPFPLSTRSQTLPPSCTSGLYMCPFFPHCHSLHPEDGGSNVIQNVGILPQHYMATQPRRPQLEPLLLWKP